MDDKEIGVGYLMPGSVWNTKGTRGQSLGMGQVTTGKLIKTTESEEKGKKEP